MQNSDQVPSIQEPVRRSRWQRFSPAMGWKSFWSEIVIVILGVLIALAANEAVQDWSWRKKVQDGDVRLQADMERLFLPSAEQVVITPCALAQLTALNEKLVQSSDAWVPLKVHSDDTNDYRFMVRIPSRPLVFPVWDSLLADGTAARFPQDRQAIYGGISSQITRAQNLNDEANQLVRRLLALGHPLMLSGDTRRYFLVITEEIGALMQAAKINSEQRMITIAVSRETKLSAQEAKAVDAYIARSGTVKFCKAKGYPLADWRGVLNP